MNRLLVLLLTPLLVVGNVFPHTHGFGDVPSDHAERPHLHVGELQHSHGGDHHGNHDADPMTASQDGDTVPLPVEHDSDAVYVNGGDFFLPQTTSLAFDFTPGFDGFSSENGVSPASVMSRRRAPEDSNFAVIGRPLFVLHAALRL